MDAVLLPKHTNVKYKSFVDLVVFSNMFVLHKRSVSRVLFNFSSYIIPQVYPLKPAFSFSANTSARRWIDVFIFGVISKTDQNTYIRTYTYIGVYIVSKHYCCKKKKKIQSVLFYKKKYFSQVWRQCAENVAVSRGAIKPIIGKRNVFLECLDGQGKV